MSPAAYYTAQDEGAAVVQTLHNFRLLCPSALFFRDGHTCEQCLGRKFAMPAIRHACYRGSRAATAVTAAAIAIHRALGTWSNRIDAYVALTPFAHAKFVAGGLPFDKLHVKPNFVHPDPGPRPGGGGYATFVGRLSQEKGLPVLLKAWRALGQSIGLKIIGDGPLAPEVRAAISQNPAIQWLGRRTIEEIYDVVGGADLHVFPSECYETFGRVAIEAFAVGTPVVASGHGGMADTVGSDGRLGALFTPGDSASLVEQIQKLTAAPALRTSMRKVARAQFERSYTGPGNHALLMEIYQAALNRRHGPGVKTTETSPPVTPPFPKKEAA
jgi:glycosyltransferase involved in cell wall biosynthesis